MRVSDFIELLLLAALWGAAFLFLRIAAPALGPIWLIEFRMLLAGLVLLPILARLQLLGQIRQHFPTLILIGGLNAAVPFSLFSFAAIVLPAGFTSILNATTPLFGIIVASVWLKEKLTFSRILGFILGFTGVVILVGWKTFSTDANFFLAVAAGLAAAQMYAIGAPFIKQKLAEIPPLVVTSGSFLGAALILLPLLPFTAPETIPSTTVIASVVALSLLSTVLAYVLYLRLLQSIGSTKTLTVAYLVPIFAMFWGATILGEAITLSMILGCAFVLLGTAIANDLFVSLRRSFD
ncbi:MAG: DMT family transporter [Cyanobacteriota bacterium]|nr:DMT family transporter [Cyanobacteriota bacterium]